MVVVAFAVDVAHPVVDLTVVDLTVAAAAADLIDAVDDYDAAAVVVVVVLMWVQKEERVMFVVPPFCPGMLSG